MWLSVYAIAFYGRIRLHGMIYQHNVLFMCLSVDGPLSCFYVLTVINNADINICVQDFVWTYVFISLQGIPGNGIAESYSNSI